VTASPHFSVEGFIPRLRDYLRVTNPYKRQFLISWVSLAVEDVLCASSVYASTAPMRNAVCNTHGCPAVHNLYACTVTSSQL
jgi:hypothetical protein